MKVIDLTHTLRNDMITYDSDTCISINKIATIEKDQYEESKINIFSHNGTHIDYPKHMFLDGNYLNNIHISEFMGQAILIDVKNELSISLDLLSGYDISDINFVIFNTGHYNKFNSKEYFYNYPILTKEASIFLSDSNIKGIGIDCISVDKYDDIDFLNHKILLKNNKLIIENLTNLDELDNKFTFIAMPLKYENSDGAPVRACGISL